MAKFVNNEAVVEDVENREPVMINSDIEEFMTLRQSVGNSNKTVDCWINQTSKLLESNRNIEMNYDKLRMKISDIDERMSEDMKINIIKKQELEDFRNAKMISSHKQWDNCLSETGNYANNFCQWMTEYNSNVLMKDIQNYHEECKKVGEDLTTLKQELDDMKEKHNAYHIETNIDFKNLSNFDNDIRCGNNNLTYIVKVTEASLSDIRNKTEKCKVAINKYEMEKNTNMF